MYPSYSGYSFSFNLNLHEQGSRSPVLSRDNQRASCERRSPPFPTRFLGKWALINQIYVRAQQELINVVLPSSSSLFFEKNTCGTISTNYMYGSMTQDVMFDAKWRCGERWIPFSESQLQLEMSITESDYCKNVIQFYIEGGYLFEIERKDFASETIPIEQSLISIKYYAPVTPIPPPTEPLRLSNCTFARVAPDSLLDYVLRPAFLSKYNFGGNFYSN